MKTKRQHKSNAKNQISGCNGNDYHRHRYITSLFYRLAIVLIITFSATTIAHAAPPNPTCDKAIELQYGTHNLSGTTIGTTKNTGSSIKNKDFSPYGVWYKFRGSGMGNTVITVTTNTGWEMSFMLFIGNCSGLTWRESNIIYDSEKSVSSILNASSIDCYIYVAYGAPGADGAGSTFTNNFTISLDKAPQNDESSDAINLNCGTNDLKGTTNGIVTKHSPGSGIVPYGAWYEFTGDGQHSIITTKSKSTTSTLWVLSTIYDDKFGYITHHYSRYAESKCTFPTTAGKKYYVHVTHPSSKVKSAGTINTDNFTISRRCLTAPALTNYSPRPGNVGTAYRYTLKATGTTPTWGVDGLPEGLSLNRTTGEITGTPTKSGKYELTIQAKNDAGTDTKTISQTIYDRPTYAGSGTNLSPYEITTAEELSAVRYCTNQYFKLMNDIDLTAYIAANDNVNGWRPIGMNTDDDYAFLGNFDGNGHKITGLWINRPETSFIGLFGLINDFAVIRNLGVEIADAGVKGYLEVGGLVGWCRYGSSITNCYATGNVSGVQSVGGLVGSNSWGHSNEPEGSTINGCYATGNVTGTYHLAAHAGGLVGYNGNKSLIIDCYATGNVTGLKTSHAGGLVGSSSGSRIINCYATGYVTGTTKTGGLLGYDFNDSVITNSYYNRETSGQSDNSGKGTPKTTAEMQQQITYNNWDFSTVWNLCPHSGYPYLYRQSNVSCSEEQPEMTPKDNAVNVALDATVSATFPDNITANDLSKITLLPDPGNVSVSLINNNVLAITHNNFAPNTKYTVTIPANATSGNARAITWSFTSGTTLSGIEDGNWDSEIQIYPNPIADYFQVKGITQSASVSVCTIDGKILLQQEVQGEENIFVGNLPSGIYLINVDGATFKVMKK